MNWQIIALGLGILLVLVSTLELLGEINKKRILRRVQRASLKDAIWESSCARFLPLEKTGRHYIFDERSFKITLLKESTEEAFTKLRLYESWSEHDRQELMLYLQRRQLAQMDFNQLSSVWWLLVTWFERALGKIEHLHDKVATQESTKESAKAAAEKSHF